MGNLRRRECNGYSTTKARLIRQASRYKTALPFRWARRPKKWSGSVVSCRWAKSGPAGPDNTQRSHLNGSIPNLGARLYVTKDESHMQDEGRVLGPLWPTSLAITPAALAARATRTMPGGYCRNSGTWGFPDAAKVGPTSGPTRKTSKTWSQDRRWATPSPPKEDGQVLPRPRERSG